MEQIRYPHKLDSKRNNLYEGDFMIKYLQTLQNGRAKEYLKAVRESIQYSFNERYKER